MSVFFGRLPRSDQANQLIFEDYYSRNRPFQGLQHYFHAPKCRCKELAPPFASIPGLDSLRVNLSWGTQASCGRAARGRCIF